MINIDNIPIYRLIQFIATALNKKYKNQEIAHQYAWWMVEAITQQKKIQLLPPVTISFTDTQKKQLHTWIKKQIHENIPLQYLLGSVPFGTCTIAVEPPILIPRLETEHWCIELIARLKKLSYQSFNILDLCTGSGCIAIALAQAFPQATVYATDISQQALTLAKKNAALNNVTNITFIASDLFSNIPPNIYFDMIVVNPPYISFDEWQILDQSVRDWEDSRALLAPENGIGIIRQIIQSAPDYLNPHPALYSAPIPHLVIEIGYQQGMLAASLFHKMGFYDIVVEKDLQGNDRLVSGCIHNEESAIT